jgi:hypothetical protein
MDLHQMIIIAQVNLSDAPPDQFKWTVIIILGLILVGLQVWTAVRQNKTLISPDPLRIEKLDKFATRDFCEMKHNEVHRRLDGHDVEIRAIYAEMKSGRHEMQTNVREDIAGVHDRINEVLGEVRELKGRVEEKL